MTWLIQVKGAVTCREVHIALSICSRSRSAHPYAPFLPIGRRVIDTYLMKCTAIVGIAYKPTMVGIGISKGSPCDVDNAVHEQQGWTLIRLPGIKGNHEGHPFDFVIAFSFYEGENGHRAPWHVFACHDIERVQSLHIPVAIFLRHCHADQ